MLVVGIVQRLWLYIQSLLRIFVVGSKVAVVSAGAVVAVFLFAVFVVDAVAVAVADAAVVDVSVVGGAVAVHPI